MVLSARLDVGAVEKAGVGWEASGETVANVETTPDTAVTLGADTRSGSGVKFPTAFSSVASTTQGRQLVRFGIWVKNPGGTMTLQFVLLHNAWLELDEI